jgi:phage terminase large subunit
MSAARPGDDPLRTLTRESEVAPSEEEVIGGDEVSRRRPGADEVAIGAPDTAVRPRLLTDDELKLLTPEEAKAYLEALEAFDSQWLLTPRQQAAEDMTPKVDMLLYGGAAGGGKTDWMLWHVYHHCLRFPGLQVLYLRRTYKQLESTAVRRSRTQFDKNVARYYAGANRWEFNNGSVIDFGYCDTDGDAYQYKSAEYQIICFDEASEFSEFQFLYIRSRLRAKQSQRRSGVWPHVLCATNPEGRGVPWLKRLFVHPTDYGAHMARYMLNDSEVVVGFVPATIADNPHIDQDYARNLKGLPEVKRRQLLYGEWDVFEGRFFPEFLRDTHVIPDFDIPETWPRIRGVDFGYDAPAACVWVAWDEDGRAYVYRDWKQSKVLVEDQARRILELSKYPPNDLGIREPEDVLWTMADYAMWIKQGTGPTIAQMYETEGLRLRRANKDRIAGWMRMRQYLRPRDVDGKPGLVVFESCRDMVHEFVNAVTDERRTDDLDTEGEDHLLDALRYALMSRKQYERPPATDELAHLDPVSRHASQQVRNLGRKRGRYEME